jgi:small subunit ribosomal protein S6
MAPKGHFLRQSRNISGLTDEMIKTFCLESKGKIGYTNSMRKYGLVIVLDGKATSAKKKAVSENLEKLVKDNKGKMGAAKDLGVKELAYKIKKSTSGLFLEFELELDGAGAKDVSNKLRLQEDLIRYLLISND